MSCTTRSLLVLLVLSATGPALGDGVDHYEVAPSVLRANNPAIYPAGVADPSVANPPGPAVESAVPLPPAPHSSSAPAAASPAGPALVPYIDPSPTPSPTPLPPVYGTPPATTTIWPPYGPVPSGGAPPPVSQAQICPPSGPGLIIPAGTAASWYTRVEYYHWNERVAGADFVNEDGSLFTIGYSRQKGIERIRAEFFGGDVHYVGYFQGTPDYMVSNTSYLGLRGEYELLLAPAAWEGRFAFLLGLGSRFWVRDLHDGSDIEGNPIWGYQETWWTTYPFAGVETHQKLQGDWEIYSESRAGVTAMTYQFVSINQRPLWPEPGLMANTEIGLRSPHFFLSARGEVMAFNASSVVQGSYQPQSIMWTAGMRTGITF